MWSIERRHFQWPWTTPKQCQGHSILWRWISHKRLKIRPQLLWKANKKLHPSFRMVQVWMTLCDLFKVTIIIRGQITWKWYNIQLCLQWPTDKKSYMIYRTAPFSMTLNDPYPQFQGHAILWRWVSQKRYYIHSFNEILIETYTGPTQQCHSEWPWVILSDLAKYSMTWGVERSLRDSWASCTSCCNYVE